MKIILPGIMLQPTLKGAGDATLKIATRELSKDEVGLLFEVGKKRCEGWVLFDTEKQPLEKDVPNIPARVNKKSPSQEQRSALFKWWNSGYTHVDFEVFYEKYMQKNKEEILQLANKEIDYNPEDSID